MAKRTSKKRAAPGQRQSAGAPPVIEDSKLPRMGEGPTLRQGSRAMMPENPPADTGKRNRMRPFRGAGSERTSRSPLRGYRDQEPARGGRRSGDGSDGAPGYLRLRVQIQEGKISLAGATVVEGPLNQAPVLHPSLAYEVMLGRRRIALGQIQDAGVWRGYPDPSGRPALSGHHITVVPSYEIAVRIPLKGLSGAALRRARVMVYRWSGEAAVTKGDGSLKGQLGRRVETIGSLKGIRLDSLSKEEQNRVRAAFQRK